MHQLPRWRRTRAHAVGVLAAATTALLCCPAPAHAAPGDHGDVKIHMSTTPPRSQLDEAKVCSFYLAAFGFDTVQLVSWTVDQLPPTGTVQVLTGSLVIINGNGHTNDLKLRDGRYRLSWTFAGETGGARHKDFDVDCAGSSPAATASPASTGASSSASPSGQSSSPASPDGSSSGTSSRATSGSAGGSSVSPNAQSSGSGPALPIGGVGTGTGGSIKDLNGMEITAGCALVAGAGGLVLRNRRRARRHESS
ncbi:hypothetical protein LN042_10875 [Kitasatospora sp. RB6PN24]|uniref:hypothetical protein n=1 Tax=Kitasatospora humi TaxID=2893891 RepID=UPI001E3986FE|nr:hypothetical protein [Kitasatospora humi]MCC9307599.1 hypothetical protein [Kitasatospora humi]